MYQKFQKNDKVRHKDGEIEMTVTEYLTKKEYTDPESLIGGARKYNTVTTEFLICRWLDRASNSTKSEHFHQSDLVLVKD